MNVNCGYAYYTKTSQSNRPYLYCNINKEICPLVKFCQTEDRIVNSDGHTNCKIKMEEVNNMSSGKYPVKFVDRGFLYVEIKDINQTKKIKNPYDYTPRFVDVVEIDGVHYIKGYEPKQEVKVEELKPRVRNPKK